MYTHLTVTAHQQVAADRRRVLLAAADRNRLVRRGRAARHLGSGRRPDRAAAPDPSRTAVAGSSLLPVGSLAAVVRAGDPAPAAAPAARPAAATTSAARSTADQRLAA